MKSWLIIFLLCSAYVLSAQLTITNGITMGLSNGVVLTVAGMDIDNQGTINAGVGSTLRVADASMQNLRTNGSTLQNLLVDQSTVHLLDNCIVLGNLNFAAGGGMVDLGDNDLVMGDAATVTGYGPNAYVVTSGAGEMAKQNLGATAFTFPVGFDDATYNPLTLAENGTADEIGVRCLAGPLTNGATGTLIASAMANTAWEVSEANAGGSNLAATAQWAAADELPGFDRAGCGIARYNTGLDWDLMPTNMGAAAGADPYSRSGTNLLPGVLAVAGEPYMNQVLIAARMMLAGPYVASANLMLDSLRLLPGFPLSAPATYGAGKFVHAGYQIVGGYTIDPSALTVSGNDAIVDWVFLWLKDPANPTTNLQTRVALIQRDGDIVDIDGVSPVKIPGNATQNYLLGVGHRNHLSVRMPDGPGVAFSETSTTMYDFTTSQSQAYGANPMRQVDTSPLTFALTAGNANAIVGVNGNNNVKYNGSANDRNAILSIVGITTPNAIVNGYYNEDVNLDGKVKYNGSANDRNVILSTVGISTPNNTVTEQF